MTAPTPLHFGPYTLDAAASQLLRDGRVLALRPKAYDLLLALVRRPGELVTKDELLDTVWGRRFISEGVIKSAVSELRQALGDDPKQPRWIETVARRGYRFARADGAPAAEAPVAAGASDGDATSDGGEAGETMPSWNAVGHLPARWSPVLGRSAELAALAAALGVHRLLTIAGPSGIGKTSVAQALASDPTLAFPDGRWFIELAALVPEGTDERSLCALLARSLQFSAAAADSAVALGRALRPLKLLLVLDNAEHLLAPLAPLAPLVATLMNGSPGLRIVVTSQAPLNLPGEQVHRLPPLSLPAPADDADAARLMDSSAVRLFIERVADRMPGFVLAPGHQRAVADICRALEGLPLALELAAARVPVLGVHGIADLLLGGDGQARLRLLGQDARTAAGRQRSLHDALAWSHGLLDAGQRRVFRQLGIFRGSFTLDAAQALCAGEGMDAWGVVDAVHALVDKSLVTALPPGDAAPRFLLLESLRAFALERLAEAGDSEAASARHAAVVCAHWERASASVLGDPILPWLAGQLPEIDNLRAALRWAAADPAHADTGLALLTHSALVWHRAGIAAEGQAWCDKLRSHVTATTRADLRRGFQLAQSVLAMYGLCGQPGPAVATALQCADDYERAGDPLRACFACYLAYQLCVQAQDGTDRDALLRRMEGYEQPGWGEMITRYGRNARGYEHRLAGRSADYLAFCRKELALCRRLGAVAESWTAAHGLMLAEHDVGQADAAIGIGRQALAEIRAAGRLRQHAPLLALWTTMLAESGDSAGTRTALAEALPVLDSAGTTWMAHVALAWLAASEGRDIDAARLTGWQEAHERSHPRLASGGYIAHARSALCEHLTGQLGASAFAQHRAEAANLGDEAAEALALGGSA